MVPAEQFRLRNFIRRHVPTHATPRTFCRTSSTSWWKRNRLLIRIEHITGWLFRVARNRIPDSLRKKKPESFGDTAVTDEDDELLRLEEPAPSPDAAGGALCRHVLLAELDWRSTSCRRSSARCSSGRVGRAQFKAMAAETGVSVNTLLSRKRYAVRHLRERLQIVYDEFRKA